MPRPRKCRFIEGAPRADYFKPRGIPLADLAEVSLPLEGLEALRLADLGGLTMETAAERMGVSRHTFGRILAAARKTVAEALTEGLALRIEGGHHALGATAKAGAGRPEDRPDRREELKNMTKIAVSSEGPTLADRVDPRFGRAAGFVLVNLETMETTYLDNGVSQAMPHGAGIQAAEIVSGAGADMVLTGYVGPKAFAALAAAGVKVGQDLGDMTVGQAVQAFKTGAVAVADGPNK